MILATKTRLTFEDYLAYDDETDNLYELEDGELIFMNPPTGHHALIVRLLYNAFEAEISRLNLPIVTLQNVGFRTAINRARIPDIVIVSLAQILAKLNVSAVMETPPIMAIEVVSPESKTRDYQDKRSEYNTAGISEYWIVDIMAEKVTVFLLVDVLYEGIEYRGSQIIISSVFPELTLTVDRILQI